MTDDDVDQEIANLKERLGGDEVYQTALAQYNLTEDQLKLRLTTTILQKKLAAKLFPDISVTDDEINKYYEQNKALFEGKTQAEVNEEIKQYLVEQKLQSEFSTWFDSKKQEAKVNIYI